MGLSAQDVIFRLRSMAADSEEYRKFDPENETFEKDRDACLTAAERLERLVPCGECRFWGYNMLMKHACIKGASPCFGQCTRPDFYCADGKRP